MSSSFNTDQKLLDSIKRDPESVLKELISESKGLLYQHIMRMVGKHDVTDDILQETYIRAWKSLQGFKGDSKLSTWVFRIATNLALTHIEKSKRYSLTPIDELENLKSESHGPSPDSIQESLDKAISLLPPRQKQVFVMRYFDELNYHNISTILNLSEGSLKASYHHAVKKIEEFLRTD